MADLDLCPKCLFHEQGYGGCKRIDCPEREAAPVAGEAPIWRGPLDGDTQLLVSLKDVTALFDCIGLAEPIEVDGKTFEFVNPDAPRLYKMLCQRVREMVDRSVSPQLARPHRSEPDQGRARWFACMGDEGDGCEGAECDACHGTGKRLVADMSDAFVAGFYACQSEQRSAVGEPVAVGWIDEFGNVYPLQTSYGWQAGYRAKWRKLYAAPTASGALSKFRAWQREQGPDYEDHLLPPDDEAAIQWLIDQLPEWNG